MKIKKKWKIKFKVLKKIKIKNKSTLKIIKQKILF